MSLCTGCAWMQVAQLLKQMEESNGIAHSLSPASNFMDPETFVLCAMFRPRRCQFPLCRFIRTKHDHIVAASIQDAKSRTLAQCEASLAEHTSAEWQSTKRDLLVSLGLQSIPQQLAAAGAGTAGGAGAGAQVLPTLTSSQNAPLPTVTESLPASVEQYAVAVDTLLTPPAGVSSTGLPLVSQLAAAAESTLSSAGMSTDLASDVLLPWRVLRHVARGEGAAAYPRAGAFSQTYLAGDAEESPLLGPMGAFWAGGSLAFLETYSSEVVEAVLSQTPASALGAPRLPTGPLADAVIARHALYMKLRLRKSWDELALGSAQHVTLSGGLKVPFWATLWHLLRFGAWLSPGAASDGGVRRHAAIEFVKEFSADGAPSQPRSLLLLALEAVLGVLHEVQSGAFDGSMPGQAAVQRLSEEQRTALRKVSTAVDSLAARGHDVDFMTLAPGGGSMDIFCAAVLQLLDPRVLVDAEEGVDTSAVTASRVDFLWSHVWAASLVALAEAPWAGGDGAAPYTLVDLGQDVVMDMGAQEWDPEGTTPYDFAKVCLLCGQPEAAVSHLAQFGSSSNPHCAVEDAVHLAVAAHHCGLLRTVSPLAARGQPTTGGLLLHAVSVRGNDPTAGLQLLSDTGGVFFERGAFALDLTTLLSEFRKERLRGDPSRAAQYFAVLGSVGCAPQSASASGSSDVHCEARDRSQLLFELLNATRAYDSLAGNLSSDLAPQGNGMLDMIAANSAYTQLHVSELLQITARAAQRAGEEGRWMDAYQCHLRACNSAAALNTLVMQLASALVSGNGTAAWRDAALQFQRSSLARLSDASPAAPVEGSSAQARMQASAVSLDGNQYSENVAVLGKLLTMLGAADSARSGKHADVVAALDREGLLPSGAADDQFWSRAAGPSNSMASKDVLQHPAVHHALFFALRLASHSLVAMYQAGARMAGSAGGAAQTRARAAALLASGARSSAVLSSEQLDELRRILMPVRQ